MIYGFTEADDCEARRMSIRFYFYGKDKEDALNRYKEMSGRDWITSGFYGIKELPKEDGKKILKEFKKAYKKAYIHIDIYSKYIELLSEETSVKNLKLEKSILKYQEQNLKKFLELDKEALKLNVSQYQINEDNIFH